MTQEPQYPNGYTPSQWLDHCQEGEALTLNQVAPTPVAMCAALWPCIDVDAIHEFTKLTRPN